MARGARVHVLGLTVGYRRGGRRRPVLRDLALALEPGTVTGLVGLNGVGKTTLLCALLGLLRPWTGSVRIDGLSPRRFRRRHGVAWLPESVGLPGELRVAELLDVGARLSGLPGRARPHAVAELLTSARLSALADRKLSALSRGQARLTALAYALTGFPALVLLDEPESGLDPRSRVALRACVREVAERGRTVLVSSHDLAELARVADRVLVLEDGRLTREVSAFEGVDLEALLLAPPASPRVGREPSP